MYPNSPNIRMHLLTLEMVPNTMGVMSYQFVSKKEVIGINFSITSREYYERAINLMKSKIEAPAFYFFSDDIEWVKKEFGECPDFKYVSRLDLKEYEELILMSVCVYYAAGQFIELYLKRTSIKLGDIIGYS